jgi:hypothetical protein
LLDICTSYGTKSITDVHLHHLDTKNVRVLINKLMISAKEMGYSTVKERGGGKRVKQGCLTVLHIPGRERTVGQG